MAQTAVSGPASAALPVLAAAAVAGAPASFTPAAGAVHVAIGGAAPVDAKAAVVALLSKAPVADEVRAMCNVRGREATGLVFMVARGPQPVVVRCRDASHGAARARAWLARNVHPRVFPTQLPLNGIPPCDHT
jgi:hypothetical protein